MRSSQRPLKKAISWLTVDLIGFLNSTEDEEIDLSDLTLTAQNLVDMFAMIEAGELSSSGAKTLIEKLIDTEGEAKKVAEDNNLIQQSDSGEIEKIVQGVLDANPKVVEQIKSGEDKAIGFLVGQVMKESRGQANPQMAQEIIRKLI